MPQDRISRMVGMGKGVRSPLDHHPLNETRCAGMSDAEMREFMKEEQKEGMHPSLKGKHF